MIKEKGSGTGPLVDHLLAKKLGQGADKGHDRDGGHHEAVRQELRERGIYKITFRNQILERGFDI